MDTRFGDRTFVELSELFIEKCKMLRISTPKAQWKKPGVAQCICVGKDFLAVGMNEGTIHVLDLQFLMTRHVISEHEGPVTSLVVSQNCLVSAGIDSKIIFFQSDFQFESCVDAGFPVTSLACSNFNMLLFIGCDTGVVVFYDLDKQEAVQTIGGPGTEWRHPTVKLLCNDTYLIALSEDKRVAIYDLDGNLFRTFNFVYGGICCSDRYLILGQHSKLRIVDLTKSVTKEFSCVELENQGVRGADLTHWKQGVRIEPRKINSPTSFADNPEFLLKNSFSMVGGYLIKGVSCTDDFIFFEFHQKFRVVGIHDWRPVVEVDNLLHFKNTNLGNSEMFSFDIASGHIASVRKLRDPLGFESSQALLIKLHGLLRAKKDDW